MPKNICPYCNKKETVINIKLKCLFFCDDCFQKWFGFTVEEYKKIRNKEQINNKLLNNYRLKRPFIGSNGAQYWFKGGQFHRDKLPAIIYLREEEGEVYYENGNPIM
jgi:hypothetical protein